jgi:hypothetical protein
LASKGVPRWLEWAREIQALSQIGLTYSDNDYDTQRYRRLMDIAAEIVQDRTGLLEEPLRQNFQVQPGYATPKVDVRGAVVRDGRILLVQERIDEHWCMPGGWADVGDLPLLSSARTNKRHLAEVLAHLQDPNRPAAFD